MQSFNLTSYVLALILILSAIFTVSWGVQRLLNKSIEAQKSSQQTVQRGKFSL